MGLAGRGHQIVANGRDPNRPSLAKGAGASSIARGSRPSSSLASPWSVTKTYPTRSGRTATPTKLRTGIDQAIEMSLETTLNSRTRQEDESRQSPKEKVIEP